MKFSDVSETIRFSFKKVVVRRGGKETVLEGNVLKNVLKDIHYEYGLSLIDLNNAVYYNTSGILKFGNHPVDMIVDPDGAVTLRYDDAKCYVYFIP